MNLRRWIALLPGTPTPRRGDHHALGARGERHAARYLRRQGYRVLARSLRVPAGEADLLCLAPDRRTIVLVEVKTRRPAPGRGRRPEAQVGRAKQHRLRAILASIIASNSWSDRPRRIDIVAIDWPKSGAPQVRHFKSAVRG